MTLNATIAAAVRAGVALSLEDGRLRYRAPAGALTPELRAGLTAHKAELIHMLSTSPDSEEYGAALLDYAASLGCQPVEPATVPGRIPLAEARALADELCALLAPACERIEVAGSIRRQRETVKDIELVVISKVRERRDLFGDVVATEPLLAGRIAELLAAGTLARDPKHDKFGPKYKRVLYRGVPVDLFIVDADNFGNRLVLHTGPDEFNKLVFTRREKGGRIMPAGMRHEDGYLWRGEARVACPDEAAFFRALGIGEVPPPRERTAETARALATNRSER